MRRVRRAVSYGPISHGQVVTILRQVRCLNERAMRTRPPLQETESGSNVPLLWTVQRGKPLRGEKRQLQRKNLISVACRALSYSKLEDFDEGHVPQTKCDTESDDPTGISLQTITCTLRKLQRFCLFKIA